MTLVRLLVRVRAFVTVLHAELREPHLAIIAFERLASDVLHLVPFPLHRRDKPQTAVLTFVRFFPRVPHLVEFLLVAADELHRAVAARVRALSGVYHLVLVARRLCVVAFLAEFTLVGFLAGVDEFVYFLAVRRLEGFAAKLA